MDQLLIFLPASTKLSCFLKRSISVALKTNNSLGECIKNNKQINQIKGLQTELRKLCKFYIGQSAFSKNFSSDSTYANHFIEKNRSFDVNFELIHTDHKGRLHNCLEFATINSLKYSTNWLNSQLYCNNSPLLNVFNK